MRLTPLDIREQQFRRVMRGLDPEEVQAFLANVAGEFEALTSGNHELRQRVADLEEKIGEYRSMEKALRDTLLTAEKVMGDAKESAQREAQLIVREAEMAAQRARSRIGQDVQRLEQQLADLRRLKDAYLSRVRWLLRSHLELLDGHAQEFAELDASMGSHPAMGGEWPGRDDAAMRPQTSAVAMPPAAAPRRPASPPRAPEPPATRPAMPSPVEPSTVWGTSPSQPPPASAWPQPAVEPWRGPDPSHPPAPEELADVLRPVGPDGSYDAPAGHPVPRPATAEEIARAARRAERLAAEARAALERHGLPPLPDGSWSGEGPAEDPGLRP